MTAERRAGEPDPVATLLGLNGRHRGETVFVVGAGPQLASIPQARLRELERRTTIGVNMTCYRLRPTYFLSAYIGQILLARHRTPDALLLHMRPVFEPPLVPGILALRREIFDPQRGLAACFAPPEPTLSTKLNVALGATHLALILGARRIVYIGVEQRNQLHFWHLDPAAAAAIRADLEILRDLPFLTVDHPYATYESQVAKLERSAEDCMQPFYSVSHGPTFRDYFACLRAAGVEVATTVADSVVADAGADYVPLAELLD